MLTLLAHLVKMFRDVCHISQVSLMLLIGCIFVAINITMFVVSCATILASAIASAAHVGMLACSIVSSIAFVSSVIIKK